MPETFKNKEQGGSMYEHLKFPEELSAKDIELIITQCEHQQATEDAEILGFTQAYLMAKGLAANQKKLERLTPEKVNDLIIKLGELTETRNKKGFRRVPVTFASGNRALDADKIPQAIESFCHGYTALLEDPAEDERLNATLLYTEFEKIHPFEDGNGRVGDLLWKILRTRIDGDWPETLPPNVFNEPNYPS
jgi:Fic family protein